VIKVLSLDGGGIRGLIPSTLLAEIESRMGKPISHCFDLIAGTSTGGILALGLTTPNEGGAPRYSAQDLCGLYRDFGEDIFASSLSRKVKTLGGLLHAKYSHKPLEGVLERYFQDAKLKDALTPVLISSYDIEKRAPFFFKSWRENRRHISMMDAARATSAAPTFFEPHQVSVEGKMRTLIDGGVFINNPAMSAYVEAKRLFPREDEFMVVSIGTGENTRPIEYQKAKSWGLLSWTVPVINIVLDGVSKAVDYQLKLVLGERFLRLQTTLDRASDDMDRVDLINLSALESEADQILNEQYHVIDSICEVLNEHPERRTIPHMPEFVNV
jgi:patatin-like phospholipase/acyl hydrolase